MLAEFEEDVLNRYTVDLSNYGLILTGVTSVSFPVPRSMSHAGNVTCFRLSVSHST
jgi:hypothetical protein